MTKRKKPFKDSQKFEIWINAKKFEGRIMDSFYQPEVTTKKRERRAGWRLLICYDVIAGNKKIVERYYDELIKI